MARGRPPLDLSGERFGKLTILEESRRTKSGIYWKFRCDCGAEGERRGHLLHTVNSPSCGCSLPGRPKGANRGTRPVDSKKRLYGIWTGMKQRCGNPRNPHFPDYGGRGITIDPVWMGDFQTFALWSFFNGYADVLSIDRIDNDGGYGPQNCRWATALEQNRNKRNTTPNCG